MRWNASSEVKACSWPLSSCGREGRPPVAIRMVSAVMRIARELERMGAEVDEVPVYRTRLDTSGREMLLERLERGDVDMVTFTSSSTARNFKALLPQEAAATLMQQTTVAAIGPITADTATDLGFEVPIVADVYTIDGLVSAICRHYQTA